MGIEGIEAEHVTLVSKQSTPRFEIQLLQYIKPAHPRDRDVANLGKLGYNISVSPSPTWMRRSNG
jgi:hypothetical protein